MSHKTTYTRVLFYLDFIPILLQATHPSDEKRGCKELKLKLYPILFELKLKSKCNNGAIKVAKKKLNHIKNGTKREEMMR